MANVHEELSERFRAWEQRGRGWQVWPSPVDPEPPFVRFPGHFIDSANVIDDGRVPTFGSSLLERLSRKLSGQRPVPSEEQELPAEPEPEAFERGEITELQVTLPGKANPRAETFGRFLDMLSSATEPLTYELIGTGEQIWTQFAVSPEDAGWLERGLKAHFPEAAVTQPSKPLAELWEELDDSEAAMVEFGLAREFMFLLEKSSSDLLVGLAAALSGLQTGELGLYQVLFKHVQNPWAESTLRACADRFGKPAFVNQPELHTQAKEKVSRPLFAVIVRIATCAEDFERTWQLALELATPLRAFANLYGNELIPLHNEDYPYEPHKEDVVKRQCRRSGMILNQDELLGLVHLPSSEVQSAKLVRETKKSKGLPKTHQDRVGILLGENIHQGKIQEVRLGPEERVRHMHVIGTSGTGKSTLLFNLIKQDIENGEGLAVLDPHGDLIERILGEIPEERIKDVVLIDPSDEEYSIGFNILSAHSDLERNLLASDLVSVFERLSTSWGDQMAVVLQNAILAFLESNRGGTLADLQKFLIDQPFRNEFLSTVGDPDVVYYWLKAFPQLTGNKSIGPILTRLNAFLAPKPIRYMVSQRENRLDFEDILDSGKIFLAKLSQGLIGKENAFLLGSLFVGKFQQLAMMRQAKAASSRRDFWLYIDEFHHFITPSMTEILTGARKYRLGLILAHQELRQLDRDREVGSAVLSNPYTRICFRVGDADARSLADGFSSFEAADLQNLNTGEALCRFERSDCDFNLTIPFPVAPSSEEVLARRSEVIDASRQAYGTKRQPLTLTPEVAEALTRNPSSSPINAEEADVTLPSAIPTNTAAPSLSETTPVVKPKPPKSKTAPSSQQIGKGGEVHKALQTELKAIGESLGFSVAVEAQILSGAGYIDLCFERPGERIACQIAVTTTLEWELGNIRKCIQAGHTKIALVCVSEERRSKFAQAVSGSFAPKEAALISCLMPPDFIKELQGRAGAKPPPAPSGKKTYGKYEVETKKVELSPEEAERTRAACEKIFMDSYKKL